jgi:hypothetical protein
MVERSLPGNPEKRKHRRAALSIRIPYFEVVHYEKDGAWGEGVSHDISAGGIFIETPTPHQKPRLK